MNSSICFALLASLLLVSLPAGDDSSVSKGTLVIANQAEHSIFFVEPALRRKFAAIEVGVNGHEVAVSPDWRLPTCRFMETAGVGKPGTDGSTIDMIDIGKRSVSGSIDLGKPLRPHRAEFGPGGMLYVTAELETPSKSSTPRPENYVGEIPTGQPSRTCSCFRRTDAAPIPPTSAQEISACWTCPGEAARRHSGSQSDPANFHIA